MKTLILSAFAAALMVSAAPAAAAETVASLRGDLDIAAGSADIDRRKQETVQGGYQRSWELQPPLIPHSIDKDRISLQENTCLRCHSEKNFEKEKAPKIGDSHYVTRDGETQDTISSRRYFCSQCHVPQLDAEPLVENTFGQ